MEVSEDGVEKVSADARSESDENTRMAEMERGEAE